MNTKECQYTRVEYKRSFLVAPTAKWRVGIAPYAKTHVDKYLCNTQLRLRVMTDTDTGRQLLKLNKKGDSVSPYFRIISRILLSQDEYKTLNMLDGAWLRKTRYYHTNNDHLFSIDVYEGELEGLILCKTEADCLENLLRISPPEYITQEVTEDIFFTGGNLCRTTQSALQAKLATLKPAGRYDLEDMEGKHFP
jgi:CYTH domain-containing protein